jgi:hypothetical protein
MSSRSHRPEVQLLAPPSVQFKHQKDIYGLSTVSPKKRSWHQPFRSKKKMSGSMRTSPRVFTRTFQLQQLSSMACALRSPPTAAGSWTFSARNSENTSPLLRRQDVRGFVRRKPIWLVPPLDLDAVRNQPSAIEVETRNFYERAAARARDAHVRKLLDDLAQEERSLEIRAEALEKDRLAPRFLSVRANWSFPVSGKSASSSTRTPAMKCNGWSCAVALKHDVRSEDYLSALGDFVRFACVWKYCFHMHPSSVPTS